MTHLSISPPHLCIQLRKPIQSPSIEINAQWLLQCLGYITVLSRIGNTKIQNTSHLFHAVPLGFTQQMLWPFHALQTGASQDAFNNAS